MVVSPERLVRLTRTASVKASEVAAVFEHPSSGVWVMFLSGKRLAVGREVTVESVTEQIDAARREASL